MKIEITKELHNELVDKFEQRAEAQGLTGKKFLYEQAAFFIGAVSVVDSLNKETEKSCVSPMVFFSIMRGDKIKKFEL